MKSLSELFLSLKVYLLVTLELLSVRNQVRKKREDLHNSQKDSRYFSHYFTLQETFSCKYLFNTFFNLLINFPLFKLWHCYSLHFFRKNEAKLADAIHEVKTSLEKIVVILESRCLQGRSLRQARYRVI